MAEQNVEHEPSLQFIATGVIPLPPNGGHWFGTPQHVPDNVTLQNPVLGSASVA